MGYYLIVTDTEETEKNYFEGLRDGIPEGLKNRLVIKVERTKTKKLIQTVLKHKDPHLRKLWIVLDRDQVGDFDAIVREAQENEIHVGWSNPCFEIWMNAYFGEMPTTSDSRKCCDQFAVIFEKKTKGQKYKKSDPDIYRKLLEYGDEENAIHIAEQRLQKCRRDGKEKPSEMCPACMVHELVREIKRKVVNPL